MAGKRTYSAEDKARVLAVLLANGGNVKRTARETSVAEQTVRDWKRHAGEGALAPQVSAALPAMVGELTDNISRVRDKALLELERQIDGGEVKGQALVTAIGVLTDKDRLIRGEATSRSETVNNGPTPQEFAAQFQGYLDEMARAALERDADIVDAEVVEQADTPALPPAS